MTFRPLALLVLVSAACGGLVEATPYPLAKDAAASASPSPEASGSALSDASLFTPPLVEEDSGPSLAPPPTATVDAGPSQCVAAGGTCLELVGCNGVGASLACGGVGSCCMPSTWDSGTCPPSSPTLGAPCDVSPYLFCGYPPCHDAVCGGGLAEAGTWWVGPDCSPPPPGG